MIVHEKRSTRKSQKSSFRNEQEKGIVRDGCSSQIGKVMLHLGGKTVKKGIPSLIRKMLQHVAHALDPVTARIGQLEMQEPVEGIGAGILDKLEMPQGPLDKILDSGDMLVFDSDGNLFKEKAVFHGSGSGFERPRIIEKLFPLFGRRNASSEIDIQNERKAWIEFVRIGALTDTDAVHALPFGHDTDEELFKLLGLPFHLFLPLRYRVYHSRRSRARQACRQAFSKEACRYFSIPSSSLYWSSMYRWLLAVRPHGNIAAEIRMLKAQPPCPVLCCNSPQEALQARENLLVRAFPEVLAVGWMEKSGPGPHGTAEEFPNPLFQHALARHAEQIFSAMPETFNLELSAGETSDGCRCVLTAAGLTAKSQLEEAVEEFAADAGLRRCAPPDMLSFAELGCITICTCRRGGCSRQSEFLSSGLSFRKADLVLYLVWLPETPFEGFLFTACACVHRKTSVESRHAAENGPWEDL